MFATILFAALPLTLPSQKTTDIAVARVRASIQREYCKVYFELKDREADRRTSGATTPANDLAIEQLRNRKAQLQLGLKKLSEPD